MCLLRAALQRWLSLDEDKLRAFRTADSMNRLKDGNYDAQRAGESV